MQASEETVVLALEVVGIPEAAWAEVSEEALEVAAAVMAPVALVELAQKATAVGTEVTSNNNNKVSSQSHGKLHEECRRQNCTPCE